MFVYVCVLFLDLRKYEYSHVLHSHIHKYTQPKHAHTQTQTTKTRTYTNTHNKNTHKPTTQPHNSQHKTQNSPGRKSKGLAVVERQVRGVLGAISRVSQSMLQRRDGRVPQEFVDKVCDTCMYVVGAEKKRWKRPAGVCEEGVLAYVR